MDEFTEDPKPISLEDELKDLIAKKMAENKVLNKLREKLTDTDIGETFQRDDEHLPTF
ncbi:MAG: hypothetical protein NT040_02095 [Bacteroidetes bacterium]|nr:hypothetical protein [Bacteroidota bacterium]